MNIEVGFPFFFHMVIPFFSLPKLFYNFRLVMLGYLIDTGRIWVTFGVWD